MSFENPLARLLASHHLLSAETLSQAWVQASELGQPFVRYLVDKQLLSSEQIAQAIGVATGLSVVDLDTYPKDLPWHLLDEKLIVNHRVLPLEKQEGRLVIATSDLLDAKTLESLRFFTRLNITVVIAHEHKLAKRLDSLVIQSPIALDDHETPEDDIDEEQLDAPTVKFVHKILTDAIKMKASDIHFEPYEKQYRIRYRIDGVMQVIATPPISSAKQIAARLKVMARLDIAERRKPQDGRIKLPFGEQQAVDFRVSTLPMLFGEKIVLRLLNSAQTLIGIDALGMNDQQKSQFLTALNKPQGMILITGPTGSGKTISLYTALGLLNLPNTNILTAEDPVEINLPGINQVNINPKIGLDFADVLRAFLRQDPDIIMVGEVRDTQTAQIAIKAAQTGHLVLSTLHTNSSAETLSRLQSMGVASFLVASCVNLVVAQRLARRLCQHCKQPVHIPKESLLEAGFSQAQIEQATTLYGPVGCHQCQDGYQGRVGIFEMLPITPKIAKLIMAKADTHSIEEQRSQAGNLSLRQAGIEKVLAGIISLQEMHRVTSL